MHKPVVDQWGVPAKFNNPIVASALLGAAAVPAAPSDLEASAASSTQIDLTWTDNSANESGFRVERSADSTTWAQIGTTVANDMTYSDAGLATNATYYYRVRAYNAAGNSAYTNMAWATVTTLGDDLVAYWRLDEHGGTVEDYAGANDLAFTVSARGGGIQQFVAANPDYLFHADDSILSTGDVDFCWAGWVRFSDYTVGVSSEATILQKGAGLVVTDYEYIIWYRSSTNRISFSVSNGAASQTVSANSLGAPATDTWYFVVCKHDATADQVSIQVNDGVVDTAALATGSWDSGFDFQFGWLGDFGAVSKLNGYLGPWGFWKGGLPSSGTLTSIYNGGSGKAYADLTAGEKTDLVAWWDMTEKQGWRYDSVGDTDLVDAFIRGGRVATDADGLLAALHFEADDAEAATIADNAALSMGDVDMAIAAWVYADTLAINTPIAMKWTAGREYGLVYGPTVARFKFRVRNIADTTIGEAVANSLGAPSAGQWYLIIGWHDSTANTLSIQVNNGTVDTTAGWTGGIRDSNEPFEISGAYGATGTYWNGRVNPVMIWKNGYPDATERGLLWNDSMGLAYPFDGALVASAGTEIDSDAYSDAASNAMAYRCEAITEVTLAGTTYEAACWWDENRYLNIASRTAGGAWTTYTYDGGGALPTIQVTNDENNHRVAVIGIDPDGYIHACYDMHNEALKYRKSSNPVSGWAGGLGAAGPMLGTNEAAVAYPVFINDPSGTLYFMFRDGGSGNGDLFFYAYDEGTTTWSAATGTAAQGKLIDGKVGFDSPYWAQPPIFDADFGSGGYLHLAWVWSDGSDPRTDIFDLSYAKWDGTSWYKSGGAAQAVAITYANCDIVETIAGGAGLFPSPGVYSDSAGLPHIAYVKDDDDGAQQVFYRYYNGSAWTTPVGVTTAGDRRYADILHPTNVNPRLVIDRATDTAYILTHGFGRGNGIDIYSSTDYTAWAVEKMAGVNVGLWRPYLNTNHWQNEGEIQTLLAPYATKHGEGQSIRILEYTP